MKLKLILFDFSGTLAYLSLNGAKREMNGVQRPKPIDFKGFFSSLKNFGLEIKGSDEDIKTFTSLFADLLGFAKDWLDFSEKLFKKFVEKPGREMIKNLADFFSKTIIFELYDDVKEILDLPFRKAILSANAKFIVEGLGLQEFAQIFTPRETKFLKPDPKAFLVVLNKLKVKPEEVLMVGDELERDLIPAKNLGMKAILIDRENKIKAPPVKKINSLIELKNILV